MLNLEVDDIHWFILPKRSRSFIEQRIIINISCMNSFCHDFQSSDKTTPADTVVLHLRFVIDQRLAGNIVQVTDAILVDDGNLEVGQIHN